MKIEKYVTSFKVSKEIFGKTLFSDTLFSWYDKAPIAAGAGGIQIFHEDQETVIRQTGSLSIGVNLKSLVNVFEIIPAYTMHELMNIFPEKFDFLGTVDEYYEWIQNKCV